MNNSSVVGMEEGEAQEIVSCQDQSWPEAGHSAGRTVLFAFPLIRDARLRVYGVSAVLSHCFSPLV